MLNKYYPFKYEVFKTSINCIIPLLTFLYLYFTKLNLLYDNNDINYDAIIL